MKGWGFITTENTGSGSSSFSILIHGMRLVEFKFCCIL